MTDAVDPSLSPASRTAPAVARAVLADAISEHCEWRADVGARSYDDVRSMVSANALVLLREFVADLPVNDQRLTALGAHPAPVLRRVLARDHWGDASFYLSAYGYPAEGAVPFDTGDDHDADLTRLLALVLADLTDDPRRG